MIAIISLSAIVLLALWLTTKDAGDPNNTGYNYDESDAPLAPRSGPPLGGWNPTERQIRENDLPRVTDSDGNVRQIEQDEFGKWS